MLAVWKRILKLATYARLVEVVALESKGILTPHHVDAQLGKVQWGRTGSGFQSLARMWPRSYRPICMATLNLVPKVDELGATFECLSATTIASNLALGINASWTFRASNAASARD